nr:glycosyltransferase family 4 protein [uncultured Desulfobacter sp.]
MLTVLNAGQNYRVIGGSDRYLLSLERLLKKNGQKVIPFAASHSENLNSQWSKFFPKSVNFFNPGVYDIFRYLYSISAQRGIEQLIKTNRPNIAHLHIYYGQLTSSIIKPLRKANIPIVQTLHEYKLICPTYSLFAGNEICEKCKGQYFWHAIACRCNRGDLLRSLLSCIESYISLWLGAQNLDHYIAVSDFLRNKIVDMGIPSEKITTIHNFIDCRRIKPATITGKYILYFGRLETTKGIYTLLDAMRQLPNVPLWVVGDGNEKENIKKYLDKNRINNVRLLGFKTGKDLQKIIKESICTVSPSEWYETFGLTLIESFSFGRPVIASAIGGMTEVVDDGVDGWLIPSGDENMLRDKINWMFCHKKAAQEMGQNGRTKVETQFNPDIHYQKILNVYQKVGAF